MKSLFLCLLLTFSTLPLMAWQDDLPAEQPADTTTAQPSGQVIRGKASYYSERLHGGGTSSGERYHKDSLTCAHLKFPFGTLLHVVNLGNGKEVTVRVNDRGPYTKKYVLDLSTAAARQIGILGHGWGNIEATVVGMDNVYKSPKNSSGSKAKASKNKSGKKNSKKNGSKKKDTKKTSKKNTKKNSPKKKGRK